MRLFSFWLLLSSLLLAFSSDEVKITPSLKSVEIFIPTQESFQSLNQARSLILTFPSPLKGASLTQPLQGSFEKIEISQNSSNQAQIILYGNNLNLSSHTTQNGLTLHISSEVLQVSWWRYFAVVFLLSITAIILLFVKKRLKHKLSSHHSTHYSETFLKAKTKLITLKHNGEEYLIFSNQNGCVLLNHYPKTKDNKEFTDLIKEE